MATLAQPAPEPDIDEPLPTDTIHETIPAGYVTYAEARKFLDKSRTTLQRMRRKYNIESAWVKRAKKKPERVLLLSRLETLKAELNAPPKPKAETELAAVNKRGAEIVVMLEALRAITHPGEPKMYVTLDEAVELTGLGVGVLRVGVKGGVLIGGNWGPRGRFVIERRSLEGFSEFFKRQRITQ